MIGIGIGIPGTGRNPVGAGGGAGLPAGDSDLITALGGDVPVLAFYDVRTGETVTGGVVDSLADCRGPGYGPVLTSTGTARPAFSGTTDLDKLITFDGIDDYLTSALSPLFAMSADLSLVFIGTLENVDVGARTAMSISEGLAAARLFQLRIAPGGSLIGFIHNDGAAYPAGSTLDVAGSATRRLMVISATAAPGAAAARIQVPDDSIRSIALATGGSAGNNALTLFDYFAAGGQNGTGTFRAALVLNREFSAGDMTTLMAYAVAEHAAVAA